MATAKTASKGGRMKETIFDNMNQAQGGGGPNPGQGQNVNWKVENPFKKIKSKKALIIIPIFILIFYYFALPDLNLHSINFWQFFFISALVSGLIIGPVFSVTKKYFKGLLIILLIVIILYLSGIELFNAKRYSNIIQLREGNFSEEIKEIDFKDIPTVDKETAIRLGNREMGELYDLVSQFNLDQSYTQNNYGSLPVRVTPLEYNGVLKWLANQSEGIPNYMMVNMINGDAKLEKLDKNIKYSHSDLFFRDVRRHIRVNYPTKIIKDISFEIDENAKPYWICPTYTNRISWFGAMDVNGVIVVDAASGDMNYYDLEDIPNWVDRAFEARSIMDQLNWYGMYKNGFFNSVLAQKGVLNTTEGYNYLAIDGDIYLYTGITSVAKDSSNIGFILVNLRTKDTSFYRVSSADEVSAMASAEGEVQEKNYVSTFPILLNIQEKPTYFLSLKDSAGLIKLYAFVDAQNYQDVSIGNTVESAYLKHTGSNLADLSDDVSLEDVKEGSGTIDEIYQVVIDGNSNYYFSLEDGDKVYLAEIKVSPRLAFTKPGDKISFSYLEDEGFRKITEIK